MPKKQFEFPEIYKINYNLAEKDPETFVGIFVSPDIENQYKLTDPQRKFIKAMCSGRFTEGWFAGGNSSGKTWAAKFLAMYFSKYKVKPGKDRPYSYEEFKMQPYSVLCTGPESKQAMELWQHIEQGFKNSPILRFDVESITTGSKRTIHPMLRLVNGATIEAVGLHDKGKHIEGQSYDLVLINEPPDARHLIHCYERVLIPRTWRRDGIICGFGTPKGKGEYYSLWRRGQKELDGTKNKYYEPMVYSQYADSRTNPYVDTEAIERSMVGKHEDWVRERVEGKFTDSAYAAFKDSDVDACIDTSLAESIAPSSYHQYIHGVDFGRKGDFTSCITWDVSVRPHVQMNVYRAGGGVVSWEQIFDGLLRIFNQYGGEFIIDSTGMGGDMQSEWMGDLGLSYVPFNFSGVGAKKLALINNLQKYIEERKFRMAPNEYLLEELRNYPADLDDKTIETDMVMGLALAAWGARNYEPLGAVESYRR